MKKLIYIPLIMCLLLFTGCGTKSVMNGIMSSWTGVHIDNVIAFWGYPTTQREVADRKHYEWVYTKSGYLPRQTYATGQVIGNTVYVQGRSTGGHQISGSCTRVLETNDDGVVIDWNWYGGNCPFAEMFEYKRWRNRHVRTEADIKARAKQKQQEQEGLKQSMEWVNPKVLTKYKALLKQYSIQPLKG